MGGAYKKVADDLKRGEGNPWVNLEVYKSDKGSHAAERRFNAEEYAGARRLRIELEFESPSKRQKYVENYTNLVGLVAGTLRDEGITGYDKMGKNTYEGLSKEEKKELQEDFITGIWGIMYSNLNVEYGINKFGFMSESLDKNFWDCDNSSTLVFDVGRELGVPVEVVMVHKHALIKTEDFFFETTANLEPVYRPVDKLKERYHVHTITSELEVIDSLAYLSRGSAHYNKEEYVKAIENFSKIIELNPKYADAYYNRGNAHFKIGEYDKAIENFSKAIELDPKDAEMYSNRGLVYDSKGEYDKAIENYDKAIGLNPKLAAAYNNRGSTYFKMGEYYKAIKNYDEAIRLDSKDANAYYNRGNAHFKIGNVDKAIEDLTIAIELNPEYADSYKGIGVFCAIKGDRDNAIKYFRKAIELDPNDAQTYSNMGLTYDSKGDRDKAVENFRKALELDPSNVNAWSYLEMVRKLKSQ
ncbi:MAG: tetratricopeptide repeat protein [Candidatus Micrarchaeota archaeon]|nr:tetratricopeptide repeat protein [Candidatus Micrarchaeota archaeon]